MIVVERPDLSSAWAATLEAVIDAGGSAVNVITSWPGTGEVAAVRDLLDTFIGSRPTGSKQWPRWPVTTVANTIFADELYDEELGDGALEEFVELYLEGREFGRSVSPTGEYCERLVAWDGPDGTPVNQLAAVAAKLKKYADPTLRYWSSSDYELAVEHPVLDLRTQMPGRNGGAIGFPCLSHISLTVERGVVHLTALYRNQHLIRKAYGNYVGLAALGRALCHHAGLQLGTITVVATHADAEVGSSAGFGHGEVTKLVHDAHDALANHNDHSSTTPAAALGDATRRLLADLTRDAAVAIGVDAVDIKDFAADLDDDNDTLQELFAESELTECDGDMDRLAARFAAKEATLKALGTGIRGIDLTDIVIHTAPSGEPSIVLSDHARAVAVERGLGEFRCSFTHEAGFAIAVVVASTNTTSTTTETP